jgi:acyl-CoA dehydrogenase
MDFRLSEEQDKFRQEVRDFLEGEIKQGLWEPSCDAWIMGHNPEFTRRVAKKGWIGLTWPKEYGGQGRSYIDRLILTEEMLRYGAPAACHWFADRQIGGAVVHYGTDQQKKELLPMILKGEAYVGLGMSEPDAGSDLASLKTKATEDGDDFIIDGQKTWTSGGGNMNWIYLVARTDPDAPKHKGISEFFFSTDLPGISVAPIEDITGGVHFNEVFFENVRIPKTCLIGERNRGFYQILNQLDYERSGMERLMANYPLFEAVIKYAKDTKQNGKPLSQDPLVRSKLAQLKIEFEIGRLHMYRVAMVMDEGRQLGIIHVQDLRHRLRAAPGRRRHRDSRALRTAFAGIEAGADARHGLSFLPVVQGLQPAGRQLGSPEEYSGAKKAGATQPVN